MYDELTPQDRKKILKLGILTQELMLLQYQAKKIRAQQRTLVTDLVQREVLSQARASRISEVGRQSIAAWVNDPSGYVIDAEKEADRIVAADKSLPDDFGTPSPHPLWQEGPDSPEWRNRI